MKNEMTACEIEPYRHFFIAFWTNHGKLLLHGVVAHLGERIAGSDEVESSSLFGSTVKPRIYAAFFVFS